jgi:pilus assembly protein Flp/PilA
MKSLVIRFIREEEGQDLVEYALLAGLVALVATVTLTAIGTRVGAIYTAISNRLNTITLP